MKLLYTLIVFTVILGSWHLNAFSQNVDFPDENLAATVRSALGLASDADIPLTSLQGLARLAGRNAGITDLTGLEKATGLVFLLLENNQIKDITPLVSLTNLTDLVLTNNPISDFTPLSTMITIELLALAGTGFSDFTILSRLTKIDALLLDENGISDLTSLPDLPNLNGLQLQSNQIRDLSPLENLSNPTRLGNLALSNNQISDITPLERFTSVTSLYLDKNQITDVTPLGSLINLEWRLHIRDNQISDISPLATLTKLIRLYFEKNQVRDLTPLENLTNLTTLEICYNPYTDISPLAALEKLTTLEIDEGFVEANRALVAATTDARLILCPPLPEPPSELESEAEPETSAPEPEPAVKHRRVIVRCGLGWSPQSQYQHFGELPKVMIYALEFEYDPERHGKYSCKTIEIRTGDDSIENLSGWNLYLGTLYNSSSIPLKIPEEHSQITGRILRITPEMLGLETFPCNTADVNGISHPLPGVHYVLKTDENVLVDTAYSCFVWGQNAYTTVNGVNVKSKRRISSAVLRQMEVPRLERYVLDNTSVYITHMNIEAFTWDRVILSDWLLAPNESSAPGAPSVVQRKLVTTWGALKKL